MVSVVCLVGLFVIVMHALARDVIAKVRRAEKTNYISLSLLLLLLF